MSIANTNFIIGWIKRMSKKFGGVVVEKNGKRWDWGQALCRERYGENWIEENLPNEPDNEAVLIAQNWERGEIPDWVDLEE